MALLGGLFFNINSCPWLANRSWDSSRSSSRKEYCYFFFQKALPWESSNLILIPN